MVKAVFYIDCTLDSGLTRNPLGLGGIASVARSPHLSQAGRPASLSETTRGQSAGVRDSRGPTRDGKKAKVGS